MGRREPGKRDVPHLAGRRLPGDHGLTSLGLIMQLGGWVFLACAALEMASILSRLHGDPGRLHSLYLPSLLIVAAGAIRSAFHRAAGSALVHGSRGGPFRPTCRYIGVALAQTALTLLIVNKQGGASAQLNLTVAVLLLAWPFTLLVVLTRFRLRGLAARDGLPPAEDKGFEGAAALMLLFGLAGSLAALFMLYAALEGEWLDRPRLLVVGLCAMLLARSIAHAVAGVKGTSGIDVEGARKAAARYVAFGQVSSVIAGGVLLIGFIVEGGRIGDWERLMDEAVAACLLLSWPLILRRFHGERDFSAVRAGAQDPGYRRAPDAGMTAVGWLLLTIGLLQVGLALPWLVSGRDDFMGSLPPLYGLDGWAVAEIAGRARSHWWLLGTCAVQLWAAIELIRMTDRRRLAATIYGGVSSAVAIALMLPQLQDLQSLISSGLWGLQPAACLIQIAFWLVVPLGTLILVNRKVLATPHAVRRRPTLALGTGALLRDDVTAGASTGKE